MNRYLHIIAVESFIYTFSPVPDGTHIVGKQWLDLSSLGNYVVPPIRVFLHQLDSQKEGKASKEPPTLFVCYKNTADNISAAISDCFTEIDLFLNHLCLKYEFGFTPLFDQSINVDCSHYMEFDITDLELEFEENTVKSFMVIDRTTGRTDGPGQTTYEAIKTNISGPFRISDKMDKMIGGYCSFHYPILRENININIISGNREIAEYPPHKKLVHDSFIIDSWQNDFTALWNRAISQADPVSSFVSLYQIIEIFEAMAEKSKLLSSSQIEEIKKLLVDTGLPNNTIESRVVSRLNDLTDDPFEKRVQAGIWSVVPGFNLSDQDLEVIRNSRNIRGKYVHARKQYRLYPEKFYDTYISLRVIVARISKSIPIATISCER